MESVRMRGDDFPQVAAQGSSMKFQDKLAMMSQTY